MHPITANCHHSSSGSGLLGNLEGKMTKNFDKMGKRLRDKLLPRDKGIFVPSSSAATGVPEPPFPRSISHVEPPMQHLSPHSIEGRRQSSPAPIVPAHQPRGPAMMPQPAYPQQPPTIGWAPLSIETFGGECAGSGFGYLNEDAQLEEEEHAKRRHVDAQKVGLTSVQGEIAKMNEKLRSVKQDNHLLNEFVANSFASRLGTADYANIERKKIEIERLKKELLNLGEMWPSIKTYTPPRPQNNAMSWACPRCADQCPTFEFHCHICSFPRPEIDLVECQLCNCPECIKIVETKLLVSVAPEDDWQMVNFLNKRHN